MLNLAVDIRNDAMPDKDDLAKGAGGAYRYLFWTNEMTMSG